jgi:phospholipase/carboxylesterase
MSTEFIHRFETGASAAEPTLLVLHGTGGDENDLIPLARLLSGSAAILSPRGQVLENGKPRFFRRLAEGVFDLDDLRIRTRELGEFLVRAAQQYGFDPSRVYAVGYSNGANVAASLLLTTPQLLAGAALLRPMVPFEPDPAPPLTSKPLLLSAGRRDPIVPPPSTQRLADIFTAAGADVTLAWQDAGHELVRRELDEAKRWFEEHAAAER